MAAWLASVVEIAAQVSMSEELAWIECGHGMGRAGTARESDGAVAAAGAAFLRAWIWRAVMAALASCPSKCVCFGVTGTGGRSRRVDRAAGEFVYRAKLSGDAKTMEAKYCHVWLKTVSKSGLSNKSSGCWKPRIWMSM